jgi:hypothetical protein
MRQIVCVVRACEAHVQNTYKKMPTCAMAIPQHKMLSQAAPLQPNAQEWPCDAKIEEPPPASQTKSDHLYETKASQSSP